MRQFQDDVKHIFLMKISLDDWAATGVAQIGQTSAYIQALA